MGRITATPLKRRAAPIPHGAPCRRWRFPRQGAPCSIKPACGRGERRRRCVRSLPTFPHMVEMWKAYVPFVGIDPARYRALPSCAQVSHNSTLDRIRAWDYGKLSVLAFAGDYGFPTFDRIRIWKTLRPHFTTPARDFVAPLRFFSGREKNDYRESTSRAGFARRENDLPHSMHRSFTR